MKKYFNLKFQISKLKSQNSNLKSQLLKLKYQISNHKSPISNLKYTFGISGGDND